MTRTSRGLRIAALLIASGLVAAACSNGVNASSGSDLSVSIASPANGAKVSVPFTVKLDSSVPLGDPSTGEHHVHLCFDGASCDSQYMLAYGNSVQVSNLAPGSHTIVASLRNADHTAAGPTATITVTVTGAGGAGSTAPSPSAGTTSGTGGTGGYGY